MPHDHQSGRLDDKKPRVGIIHADIGDEGPESGEKALQLATDEEQLVDSKRHGGDSRTRRRQWLAPSRGLEHRASCDRRHLAHQAPGVISCLVRRKSIEQTRRCRRRSSLDSISRHCREAQAEALSELNAGTGDD